MITVMDDDVLSRLSSRLVTSTARSTTEQKEKGKCGRGILCAFSTFSLNDRDNNQANPHLAIIRRYLYMYIFAWLQKKRRASYKQPKRAAPPTFIAFFCLQVRSHLSVLVQEIAFFAARVQGSSHSQWVFLF